MNIKCFELAEITRDGQIAAATLYKDGEVYAKLNPFVYQPINVTYDIEGIEHIEKCGEVSHKIRFSVQNEGVYMLLIQYPDNTCEEIEINASGKFNHGFIKVSDDDNRYFSFSDSSPYYPIGINLAFPTSYGVSDGTEFGLTSTYKYIGLKQYEYWLKRCSENGVNMVRVWVGHDYFTPDTDNVQDIRYEQYTKLDMLIDIAKKYGIYLKLTVEHFRFFVYEDKDDYIFNLFNKRLSLNGEKCTSTEDWMREEKWRNAWLDKIKELSARYAYDTSIFAIELWNEMNCMSNTRNEWNREMLPRVKELFPNTMVVNSLGSLSTDRTLNEVYNTFPWDKCDFKQMHRYLDQGGEHIDTTRCPIEVIQAGMKLIKDESMPFVVAETGAVNNSHSGPFKYYSCDDRGIIFVDCVYTPVFLGSASCGHIWHWDNRYVESKNLYKYYRPLSNLIENTDFAAEKFKSTDLSDDNVYLFLLEGENTILGFIRNKNDSWQNTLRDGNEPSVVPKKQIVTDCVKRLETYPIWDDDTSDFSVEGNKVTISNIRYGTIFKIYKS